MTDTVTTIQGVPALVCAPEGEKLKSEQDALDLIGETWGTRAQLILIPVERLTEDFFELKTRLAGEIIQKFANYRFRVAILGDISPYVAQSRSFRDFVYEANKGHQLWFVTDLQELEDRLKKNDLAH
uniref:DUF4180 domain-containing protein n=1 Tax=Thermosporothrix sp. COM3 TaxID=2490863 RepID=A0A455SJF4_9CHLR|nr:hypothetical protein KTC_26170 [Thermosporothrix sp. COM3]